MKMKQYFAIIFLVLMFLNLAGSAQAYPTIIEDYPLLPACKDNVDCRPGQEDVGLPEFIKYIFIFSLGVVGIIGMLALIIAAFDYVLSAGNPQKAAAGKDKITSALLGLLLLLASWVLLNMINPDLLKLREPTEAKPIDIIVEPGEETRCQYTTALWKPTTVKTQGNTGENVTLTIIRKNCTIAEAEKHTVRIEITQKDETGGTYTYTDMVKRDKIIKITDTEWVTQIPFYPIVNVNKNKPETLYATGWIEIPGQKDQKFAKTIVITVQDLKDDGTCCK